MKNKGSIIDYFEDGIEEIFNPKVAYDGNYPIKAEVFSYVAKTRNGKNLFDEFMDKRFTKQINEILSNMNPVGKYNYYFVSDADKAYGRTLKVSGLVFLIQFCMKFIGECPDLPDDISQTREILREYFRKYRKDITRLLNNEVDEDTMRIDKNLKEKYLVGEEYKKKMLGDKYRFLSYKRYLELTKENIGTFLLALRYLIPLFDKEINLKELEECLDLDKFFLAMTKQLIDISRDVLCKYGKVQSSFIHVEHYILAVKKLRTKGDYNVKVQTCLSDGSVGTITVDDVIREYNEIKVQYPGFSMYSLEDDGTDYRDLKNAMDLKEAIEEYAESKKLEASWEFIRKGAKIEPVVIDINLIKNINTKHSKKKKTKTEKEQLIVDRMNFLDGTDYLYKMTGKNNFTGYIGYIYANGTVIFEKYYKNFETREPVESNATYVMNFSNFVQMSMLTKTEIIDYIKNGGNDVRRVYHTGSWCERIVQIINGNTYDEKTMDKIDRLINDGKLKKKIK